VIKDLLGGLFTAAALLTTTLLFSQPARSAGDETHALERYREVLDRPLFSPTRRPSETAPAPAGGDESGMPVLQGTVVSPGRKFALFAGGPETPAHRVAEGETIGRWTVAKIAAARVILKGEDGAPVELTLKTEQAEKK
jgi:hypothetical protein